MAARRRADDDLSGYSRSTYESFSSGANSRVIGRNIRVNASGRADIYVNITDRYPGGWNSIYRYHETRTLPGYESGNGLWPGAIRSNTAALGLLVVLTVCLIGQVFLTALRGAFLPGR